jgi:hypothetical protein
MKRVLLAGALLALAFNSNAQNISTVAGNSIGCCSGVDSGSYSGDGGAATAAGLYWPTSVDFDGAGNMFIADFRNNRIRKVSSAGIITTVAGNGTNSGYPYYTGTYSGDGGVAIAAGLNQPTDAAVDGAGNVYICDAGNYRVRKVSSTGITITVAGNGTMGFSGDGGAATSASITANAICLDAAGNLYISGQFYVRKVNSAGVISTIAGNGGPGYSGDGGPATAASITPSGLDIDGAGNIYIADFGNRVIRKINALGIISTVAGDGTTGYSGDGGAATLAKIFQASDVKVDASGNLYINDGGNQVIRKVSSSGIISTVAGTAGMSGYTGDGGMATNAKLNYPHGVAFKGGNLFIADQNNNVIRKVQLSVSSRILGILSSTTNLSIAPNPNKGWFTITLKSDDNDNGSIIVRNCIGQKIVELSIRTNEQSTVNLDVPPGIYFITATTTNSRYFEKVIVE